MPASARSCERAEGVPGRSSWLRYLAACLAPGVAEIEGGVSFSRDTHGTDRSRTLTLGSPQFQIRVGRCAELGIGGGGIVHSRTHSDRTAGWPDLTAGGKFALTKERWILSTCDPRLAATWLETSLAGLSLGATFTPPGSPGMSPHAPYASVISKVVPMPAALVGYVEPCAVRPRGQGHPLGFSTPESAGSSAQVYQSISKQGVRSPAGSCWFVAAGFAVRHASRWSR